MAFSCEAGQPYHLRSIGPDHKETLRMSLETRREFRMGNTFRRRSHGCSQPSGKGEKSSGSEDTCGLRNLAWASFDLCSQVEGILGAGKGI